MSLDARLVEIFRAVMTTGTVTGAAEILHTSQPAVSRSLKRLEAVLDLILFTRSRGRLVPTAHGLGFFEEVQKAFIGLERLEHVAQSLKRHNSGAVSIICAPLFSLDFIADATTNFIAKHPDVNISITTDRYPLISEWMTAQRFDIGLAAYSLNPAGVSSTTFAEPNEICILPPSHPLAREKVITPRMLGNERWVFLDSNDPYRHRLDLVFARAGVERKFIVETPNSATVCALVLRGNGIGVVNPFTAIEYAQRGLVIRAFSEKLPFTTTLLRAIHRPNSSLVDLYLAELKATRDRYLGEIERAIAS